jgi:hypothetical protein
LTLIRWRFQGLDFPLGANGYHRADAEEVTTALSRTKE